MCLSVTADELFGLLSNEPEEVCFTCQPCRRHPAEHSSLKVELQSRLSAGLEDVLIDLLSDSATQHLLICESVRATQESCSEAVCLTLIVLKPNGNTLACAAKL